MNVLLALLVNPGRHCRRLILALLAAALSLTGHAAEMPSGHYYWYVPEHEKYVQTEFFAEPDFGSAVIKIERTQRFVYVGGQRGWAQLEFDDGTQAFIHLRLLRALLHDPAAHDPWAEFARASVFARPPDEIEAQLKPASAEPRAERSELPVWKRYKESWHINRGRTQPDTADGDALSGPIRFPARRGKILRSPLKPPADPAPPADSAP